jgi:tryptophan-rich sensory protein
VRKPKQILKFLFALAVCFGVSGSSAIFTSKDSLTNWYYQLEKPIFTPPDLVFGPTWTILYLLMAISVFLVWNKGQDYPRVKQSLIIFLAQLVLNAIWTPLFFRFHLIMVAFIEIIMLWFAILATILTFKRISLIASIILVPYLIWVGYATVLNGSIWYLNR